MGQMAAAYLIAGGMALGVSIAGICMAVDLITKFGKAIGL